MPSPFLVSNKISESTTGIKSCMLYRLIRPRRAVGRSLQRYPFFSNRRYIWKTASGFPNPNPGSPRLPGAMASTPAPNTAVEKMVEKSYLASAVDSINPWAGPRSATPTPKDPQPALAPSTTVDHTLNPFYGQSFKRYPPDCPPPNIQWFHAVDVSVSLESVGRFKLI